MSNQFTHSKKVEQIEDLKELINNEALKIGKISPLFREIVSAPLSFTCYEAGFIKMVSWLYMLYYESGRGELEYATERFDLYNIDSEKTSRSHYKVINNLRTVFQHNAIIDTGKNITHRRNTESWFNRIINVNAPSNADEWEKSFNSITEDSLSLMTYLLQLLNEISRDDLKESILEDWHRKSSRTYQHYEFDSIIYIVAQEFGMSNYDVAKFRKQNAENWISELQNFTGNFEFKIEARKLIERDILRNPVLPIIGTDIMEVFNIPPGPKVREIMKIALGIYIEKPCTKDELITKIKSQMNFV